MPPKLYKDPKEAAKAIATLYEKNRVPVTEDDDLATALEKLPGQRALAGHPGIRRRTTKDPQK